MAATRITALTAATTLDYNNDAIPVVDVSDTTQAPTGTTKKTTVSLIDQAITAAGNKAIVVDNVAALKALTVSAIADGQLYITRGYYSDNDGGQGTYIYDSASAATNNNGTIIAPTSGAGRFLLQNNGSVNVKQFGAKADGSTDDSSKFNAAINSSITELFVPSGTYRIGGDVLGGTSIILKSNFRIVGTSGSKIAVDRGDGTYTANGIRINNATNVVVSNLELYSTVNAFPQITTGILVLGTLSQTSNVLIEDCVLHHFTDGVIAGASGIYQSKNIKVVRCTSYSCANNGMATVFANTVEYNGCRMYSNGLSGGNGYGLDVESNPGQSIDNVTALNCLFEDNASGGIAVVRSNDPSASADILNIQIRGCTSKNNPTGIFINGSTSSFIDNVIISNNITLQSSSRGISVARSKNIFIENNKASDGVIIIGCTNGSVTSNVVTSSPDNAFEVSSAAFSSGLCISDNIAITSNASGFNITLANGIIKSNLVKKAALNGITVNGTNCVVSENSVYGSGNNSFGNNICIGIYGNNNTGSENIVTKYDQFSTGTAQTGASTSITLDSEDTSIAGVYAGCYVGIVSGTGVGQVRQISSYSASRIATVSAAWDTTPNSTSVYEIGNYSVTTITGTAQSGGSNYITLPSGFSSTSTKYVGGFIKITAGTGSGQNRLISAYNGATKEATVSTAWTTQPDSTSQFSIVIPNGAWRGIVLTGVNISTNNNSITNAGMATDFLNAASTTFVQPKIFLSSAAPTIGDNIVGDIALNSSPSSGNPAFWQCRVAGAPGTWIAGPNIP